MSEKLGEEARRLRPTRLAFEEAVEEWRHESRGCPLDEDLTSYFEGTLQLRRRLAVWWHVRRCALCRADLSKVEWQTTVKQAAVLARWGLTARQSRVGDHVPTSQIYKPATQQLSPEEREVTDWALLLAAASRAIKRLVRIQTEEGKYTIALRPGLSPATPWIVTVEVSDLASRKQLEGRAIRLKDGRGRIVLQGEIAAGEVSQKLDGTIEDLDLTRWVVEPKGVKEPEKPDEGVRSL